jgi:hypothetical protein
MDCIKDWKTGKVGGAYLFEKSRGKTQRETIRGQRLYCAITGNNREAPKLQ